MFKYVAKDEKKCDTCGQIISCIEHLIGDTKIIYYNQKTHTWTEKVLKDGNKKA